MTETRELLKYNGRSLVEIKIDGVIKKYVVCRNYDPTKEYGNQWDAGSYFDVWGNTTAENMCRTATLCLYDIKEIKPVIPYERMEELAKEFVTLYMEAEDGGVSDDTINYLKGNVKVTKNEADILGIADVLYPKTYDIVEVTIERTQKTTFKAVVPAGTDPNVYDIEDYVSGYDYAEAEDEGDWEITEVYTDKQDLDKEEVKDRYSEETLWNYEDLDEI